MDTRCYNEDYVSNLRNQGWQCGEIKGVVSSNILVFAMSPFSSLQYVLGYIN